MKKKVQILSDLHNEFTAHEFQDAGADLLVLAGDIGVGTRGAKYAKVLNTDADVVYTPGNHEYYDGVPMKYTDRDCREILGDSFLQMDVVEKAGLLVAGCTLWTDMDMGNQETVDIAAIYMNDYQRLFTTRTKRAQPEDTMALHYKMINWLQSIGKVDVVVTHHAPSKQSIHEKYSKNALNGAYASSIEDVVEKTGAKLWVHGHMHNCVDYMIGDCRVVTNPRGYTNRHNPKQSQNTEFNPLFTVDI